MTTLQAPRTPTGYTPIAVDPTQILLPLTISNKCGQAFRWYGVELYEPIEESVKVEAKPQVKIEDGVGAPPSVKLEQTYNKVMEYSMCLSDRIVFVRQDEERGYLYYKTLMGQSSSRPLKDLLQVEAETGAWLRDYLNLDVPLEALYEEWSAKDPVFARFAKRFTGIRMLRQDPLETLCAFICSSNNNIARIGQMVQNLCRHFAEPMATITYPPPPSPLDRTLGDDDDEVELAPTIITYYPFPDVEKLARPGVETKLRDLAFGYRAAYIQGTAQLLLDVVRTSKDAESDRAPVHTAAEYLASLRLMDYPTARQELMQFPGVGPKVADCILLMAMDQPSSIPVDRHVFQFAERWYKIRTKGGQKGYEHIADTFRKLWGTYAGWAHSVLFTADLRAFQTYKVEDVQVKKLEGGHDAIVKREEEVLQNGIVEDANHVVQVKQEQWLTNDEAAIDNGIPASVYEEAEKESPRANRWKRRTQDSSGFANDQTILCDSSNSPKRARRTVKR